MLKGTQRKVIVLKDTKSGIFDEAYFIVKNSADSNNLTTNDMINEANRIIDASLIGAGNEKRSEKLLRPLWFFVGVFCYAAISVLAIAIDGNYL